MRRFAAWPAEEGEVDADPFLGLKPPKLDQAVAEPLTDDGLRALLKACIPPEADTPAEAPRHRRDEALTRIMRETGVRAGEVVALEIDDVDLDTGVLTVRRGKGGKGRTVPIGPQAALALDRYLRLRQGHRLAGSSALWLGDPREAVLDALHTRTMSSMADPNVRRSREVLLVERVWKSTPIGRETAPAGCRRRFGLGAPTGTSVGSGTS